MAKSLIIDTRLIQDNLENIFTPDLIWPIHQSQYDKPLARFIRWLDEIHKEIKDNPRLLNAFLLVKSDLTKDLCYYTSSWIDVAEATQNDTELIYGNDQHIIQELLTDEFYGHLPTDMRRYQATPHFKSLVRSRLSRLKRHIQNRKSLTSNKSQIYCTSLNHLGNQIAPATTLPLRFTSEDVHRKRKKSTNTPNRVEELAHQISDNLIKFIGDDYASPSRAFSHHLYYIALKYLQNGWTDAAIGTAFPDIKVGSTLITGTGSGYSARLLSYQFLNNDQRVIRTTHGGDQPFFSDMRIFTTEFPFASKYVTYGDGAAQTLQKIVNEKNESNYRYYTKSFQGAGSDQHTQILHRSKIKKTINNVAVITGSFYGMYRVVPHRTLHDIVYMEWHRRLLKMTRSYGYTVISKRHPKGFMSEVPAFSDIAQIELLNMSMKNIEQQTDAYVIDVASSAFMEAICTLKPVVLIDMPMVDIKADPLSQMRKSVSIIPASFDENNLVTIERELLREALEKPVDIAAREQLINDYLLTPSANLDSILE